MNPYLIAAYAAVWIIHSVYIASILFRYSSTKREAEELKREKAA
jgi:CcmD family protein